MQCRRRRRRAGCKFIAFRGSLSSDEKPEGFSPCSIVTSPLVMLRVDWSSSYSHHRVLNPWHHPLIVNTQGGLSSGLRMALNLAYKKSRFNRC